MRCSGEVPGEQLVVGVRQIGQGAPFPGDVRFAGVPAHAGEQQHGRGAGDPHAGEGSAVRPPVATTRVTPV